METKLCSKCQRILSVSDFNRDRNQPDGFSARCRTCTNAYHRAWYAKNRELERAAKLRQMQARIDKGQCKYCCSPQLPGQRVCQHHWFSNVAYHSLGKASNRAAQILKDKLAEQNSRCPYTGIQLIPGQNCQIDHIKPVSRFPELRHDPDNLEWVLDIANLAKRDLTKEEFIAFCRLVTKNANSTGTAETGPTPVESGVARSPKPEALPLAAG